MITITQLEVGSFSLDYLDLSWAIADTAELLSIYRFQAERSESPEGPFESVSPELTSVFSFRDDAEDLHLRSRWREFFYRIKIRNTVTSAVTYSPVNSFAEQPDLVGLEAARLVQLVLKVATGTPVLVFKRRTSGPTCPLCFDNIRERTTDSQCTFCFSSKYRGGYLNPIGTFINFNPNRKALQIAQQSESEPSDKTLDASGYPPLVPLDLIVEPTNRRWQVVSVEERSKQGFVHRQIVRVNELARTDVVYQLPIPKNLFPRREGPLWPKPADYGPIQFVPETPPGR